MLHGSKGTKKQDKKFSIMIIRLCQTLPFREEYRVISKQLLRSATSVGANYRAACRARSRKEFVAKLGIVIEEADESCYWLELLNELCHNHKAEISELWKEGDQLTRIFNATKTSTLKRDSSLN